MRHVILLDNKIDTQAFKNWVQEDTEFWEEHLGITPTYEVIEHDFSDYPTIVDFAGDTMADRAWMQVLNDTVVKKYGEFGFDFLMLMIHSDNWKSDRPDVKRKIWGSNYSYTFGKQNLCYCRWDKNSPPNTFGVAYHERHHSLDAIIQAETGVNITPILKVQGYDNGVTHGREEPWKYIRYKENIKSLQIMKVFLTQAFDKRKQRHEHMLSLMGRVIELATSLLYLLRQRKAQKDGINNKCIAL